MKVGWRADRVRVSYTCVMIKTKCDSRQRIGCAACLALIRSIPAWPAIEAGRHVDLYTPQPYSPVMNWVAHQKNLYFRIEKLGDEREYDG